MKLKLITALIFITIYGCNTENPSGKRAENTIPANMFQYSENLEPRWVSFENITGSKGQGGKENSGAKGHASDNIKAGETRTLLNMEGPGIINRIWITISDRKPEMLRSLIINMYWDNEEKPAVSVPFGDFFGIGLGKTAVYENELFANPEGRSFNCFIQMPFKKAAKIEIVNESSTDLKAIFFDVNLQLITQWDESNLYFHSYWHRDTSTILEKDFEIMPAIKGKGRFLGSNICINANPVYKDCWWGEGEVKIYLNGDDEYPTLVGSGTEDYIGTAWGQGQFCNKFTGCLVADSKNRQWAYYRYHIDDPVYFKTDCKVTIQQIGGNFKEYIDSMVKQGVNLIPITVSDSTGTHPIYKKGISAKPGDPEFSEGWINFYRSDDMAATAYFYLNSPKNDLPSIQSLKIRNWKLK